MSGELVLVTGGSGFIGAHCIVRLLDEGYRVRTTVRSPAREADARAMVKAGRAHGGREGADLSFAVADLGADGGWAEAVAGCGCVLHVASPFPPGEPEPEHKDEDEDEDEDELIVPARDGALRVLRAARDAGVRRVVLTSSFGAVGYGHPQIDRPSTEETWTDVSGPDVNACVKSKTLAERAAWEFAAREGGGTELAVVNPVGVFGPVLGPDCSASVALVRQLLDGGLPGVSGVPRVHFAVVDVRDVADLHLLAMTGPAAAGERFVAAAGETMSLREVAVLLKERMGADAARVPTAELPDAPGPAPSPGRTRHASSEKARRLLGWAPRFNEEAVLATARSLVRLARRQR